MQVSHFCSIFRRDLHLLFKKMANPRVEVENYMTEHDITFKTVEHTEVFTVEAMMAEESVMSLPGITAKNLFVKDKKKNLFLVSAAHNAEVSLAEVAKIVGAKGGLRLADEAILEEKLGVTRGCVSALALFKDTSKAVSFACDKTLIDGTFTHVNFHPMVNSATTSLEVSQFLKFLECCNHIAISLDLGKKA